MRIDGRNKRSNGNGNVHNYESAEGDIVDSKESAHKLEIQNVANEVENVCVDVDYGTKARRDDVTEN